MDRVVLGTGINLARAASEKWRCFAIYTNCSVVTLRSEEMSLGSNQSKIDPKLQQDLMIEEQKAKFQVQVHRFTDLCWDKCVDKPSNKLDSRTETCMVNCVERFIDTTMMVTNRFAELIQRSGGFQ